MANNYNNSIVTACGIKCNATICKPQEFSCYLTNARQLFVIYKDTNINKLPNMYSHSLYFAQAYYRNLGLLSLPGVGGRGGHSNRFWQEVLHPTSALCITIFFTGTYDVLMQVQSMSIDSLFTRYYLWHVQKLSISQCNMKFGFNISLETS